MTELPNIATNIPFLESLFSPWKDVIGDDYEGYRNHVYRMVQFSWALAKSKGIKLTDEDKQKTMIAAVFHDIGIWTDNTVDYIEPSLPPAMKYLEANELGEWKKVVHLMITEHHKLTCYKGEHQQLVELFRQADLVDFSLGLVKNGLPKSYIQSMKLSLPNKGFHKGLMNKAGKWFMKHPLNPAPMMKW